MHQPGSHPSDRPIASRPAVDGRRVDWPLANAHHADGHGVEALLVNAPLAD